jgi:RHS repeat-associated protein
MVEWQVPNTNQAWNAYDASGNRTIQRSTSGGITGLTVYAFGLEEYQYDGSGNLQSSTHYYTLAGHLIGELQTQGSTSTTTCFVTDGLGSILAAFSNTAGSATLLASQLFAPYGVSRYGSGSSMSSYTSKGFTGQYGDAVTGLDYYVSRYYDPVSGLFLSADKAEGNAQGLNPYAYVGGNPETASDPTGQMYAPPGGGGGGGGSGGSGNGNPTPPPPSPSGPGQRICQINGGCSHTNGPPPRDVLITLCEENASCRAWTFNQSLNGTIDFFAGVAVVVIAGAEILEVGGTIIAMYGLSHPEEDEVLLSELDQTPAEEAAAYQQQEEELINQLETDGVLTKDGQIEEGYCSFTPTTVVETSHGEQAIGTLKIGEKVLAYNPKTKKMEYEPIVHVWIHKDHDLVDLTLTQSVHAPHSAVLSKVSETIHTNKKHPFFTEEYGFLPVAQLKLGMHILQADGHDGVVTGWRIVSGSKMMYNLTVLQDHTFVVGMGQWVVHNDGGSQCGGTYSAYGAEDNVLKGVDNIKQSPNFASYKAQDWTFDSYTIDPIKSQARQQTGWTDRYYFYFVDENGRMLQVSADYNSSSDQWNTDDFHLSSDQPSGYWQNEYDANWSGS